MYSPFQTAFDSLTSADLECLGESAEGWYVEYKRELPNAGAIAKSISALANTYGGWVFYGVEEKSKDDPVAGAFPGLAASDAGAALQTIRQAVANHMNPAAHFDVRIIEGEGRSALAIGRVIICVRVPPSHIAPHVHKTGHIYRRVADGSEPRPENDRHLLDQLFRRGDEVRKMTADWLDRDPEFSKAESEYPYARLMLMADPWLQEDPWLDIGTKEMKEVFNSTPTLVSGVPFDTLYTSSRGYVARQINTNDPHHLGLTWRLRESLVSDVIIPLNFVDCEDLTQLAEYLSGYEEGDRFVRLLRTRNHRTPRVVDLNIVFNLLVGLVETQRRILRHAGWKKPFYAKIRLLNTWRTLPFLDIEGVLDEFDQHGIPMCLDGTATFPVGSDPDSVVPISTFENADEPYRIILQAMEIFQLIARPLGLPLDISARADRAYVALLYDAGSRASRIMEGRFGAR